jgi:transcriptional regulator with XRE-family HTH domain
VSVGRPVARREFGELLRQWRTRRRLSQQGLGLIAEVSARHLSFIETGRSRPSREMVLFLAEHLEVPLRERNDLLMAAGYAPAYPTRALDDPEMAPVREALDRLLAAHDPYPAAVIDGSWQLLAANRGVQLLTEDVAPHLLEPPVNVLRATLHPDGMAPRIVNFGQWSQHLLHRLALQVAAGGGADLARLHEELACYPGVAAQPLVGTDPGLLVALPLVMRTSRGELSLLSTVAWFGSPYDVGLSELRVESFYPADRVTAARLSGVAPAPGTGSADAPRTPGGG